MDREELIFALDIGTRTVVGLIMEPTPEGLRIIASRVYEHENRAMLDGQIHNVIEVARAVKLIKAHLEEAIGQSLHQVAVAAAGRALKTIKQTHSIDLSSKREILPEDVNTLELAAVQNAQKLLAADETCDPSDYHFVGYSVIAYRLDDMHIGNLVGQKGRKIEVDIISTFLPRIVVDSLITVLQHADLSVRHMTLEPIAASNVVIPKEMHNFNLALVDIGAGTSDIAITRGGAIVAYAMVPVAGDEITEALAEQYLLNYASSEELKRSLMHQEKIPVKDIMGFELEVDSHEALMVLQQPVDQLATLIANEILSLNQKPPQAVILVGGGSLTPLLTQKLAELLQLPQNRVGVKQAADIKGVLGEIPDIESVQAITPIGIAVTCHQNTSQTTYIDVKLNDQRVSIFSLTQPTVSDALLASDTRIQRLHGRPGMALTFKVNGQLKTIKGTLGETGRLEVNGQPADLTTPITHGNEILYSPGRDGESAAGFIRDVVTLAQRRSIYLNGTPVSLTTRVLMNGNLVGPDTPIADGAEIQSVTPVTYHDVLTMMMEVPASDLISREMRFFLNSQQKTIQTGKYEIKVNGSYTDLEQPFSDGDTIEIHHLDHDDLTIGSIFARTGGTFDIMIQFNGRELSIPTNFWEIQKNGEEVTIDTCIEEGDEIICQPQPISFSRVLAHINYQIPDSIVGRLELLINGENATLTDPVQSGDNVKIQIR